MGRRRAGEPPSYCLQRSSGLAYVQEGGKRIYLGRYGTPESRRRYREWLEEWEGRHQPARPSAAVSSVTMHKLVAMYLEHAREHYRRADGVLTSGYDGVVWQVRDLLLLHGTVPPAEYRARHLEQLRAHWVERGLARVSCNKGVSRVRRLFSWAHVAGLVGAEVVASLAALSGLQAGRTRAPDYDPIPAVPEEHVWPVLPWLRPPAAAMVQLQWHAGLRPGEACALTSSEVRRDGTAFWGGHLIRLPDPAAWVLQPGQYKTRHRGKFLAYVLGPQAREILKPWLVEDPEAAVFSSGVGGHGYCEASYRDAVLAACARAGVPRWTPNQLRHAYISRVERKYDLLDAAKAVGHATPSATLGYVQADLRRAAEIAAQMG